MIPCPRTGSLRQEARPAYGSVSRGMIIKRLFMPCGHKMCRSRMPGARYDVVRQAIDKLISSGFVTKREKGGQKEKKGG